MIPTLKEIELALSVKDLLAREHLSTISSKISIMDNNLHDELTTLNRTLQTLIDQDRENNERYWNYISSNPVHQVNVTNERINIRGEPDYPIFIQSNVALPVLINNTNTLSVYIENSLNPLSSNFGAVPIYNTALDPLTVIVEVPIIESANAP